MIRNLARLTQRLSGMEKRLERVLAEEMTQVTREAMERARERAPVGKGPRRQPRLKDSFSMEVKGLEGTVKVVNPHGAYVEFGTGRRGAQTGRAPGGYDGGWPGMAAQPYLFPVAMEMRGEFPRRMGLAVLEGLKERRNGG